MSKASRQKQRIWLILAFAILTYFASDYSPDKSTSIPVTQSTLEQAIQQQSSNVQLEVSGIVIKLLADDLEGRRHQKFLIKTANEHTLLIVHNIDLAPRINSLQEGDSLLVFGEYEWNEKGGLIHWTHHDPAGQHVGGWIKHQGQTYQ
ncbi:MAG: DUF3465 domain-containing protein [Methylophaga sp.]|nr:DUF3465 domain-containing protein [Methylophaga sp.]